MDTNNLRSLKDTFHPITYSVNFEVYETHGHTYREITYIAEGEGYNIINGYSFPFKKGSLFFLGPQHMHRYKIKNNVKYRHRDIYIDEEQFKRICDAIAPHIYQSFCDENHPVNINITEENILSLDSRLRHIQSVKPEDISESDYTIRNAIVAEIIGLYIETMYLTNHQYPIWIQNLLADMNSTSIICGTFKDLVESSYYSAGHLSREFKHYVGISPSEYLSEKKLTYAAQQIANTSKTIQSIISEIGFKSVSFFIKKFEKTYGVSPMEYRKKNKNNIYKNLTKTVV